MRVLNLLVAAAAAVSAAIVPRAGDSLSLSASKPALTFDYTVSTVSSTNWVALYSPGNSPTDPNTKRQYGPWVYVKDAAGSAFIDAANVNAGDYNAYLLANDGYTVLAGPVKATVASKPGGSSSFAAVKGEKAITFTYKTGTPDPKNWIALYPANSASPAQSKYLAWAYAPGSSGKIVVDGSKLNPGNYDAYYLYKDGYTQLADKIAVVNEGDTGPVKWIVKEMTLQNARQGDKFSANIAGIINRRVEVPEFKIVSQTKARWVSVDAKGNLSGTPTCAVGNATVVVQATLKDGSSDKITVTIPIVAKGEPLVKRFRMYTMNIWVDGAYINDYYRKRVSILASLNADIVAIQETRQKAGQEIAQAMGWNVHYTGDTAVLSRYPLTALNGTDSSTEAKVLFDGEDSSVIVWSAHLGYDPYGPYDFCKDHMTQGQVFAREAESGRTPQVTAISDVIKDQLQSNGDKVPVILAGDFNAPSHLDWTDAARDLHCGVGYTPWPTSIKPIEAGLKDSFRELHPDPVADPANTWSPVNPAPAEPQDRIDFIYYGGGAQVTASMPFIVGKPKNNPDVADNEWPSDHMAFVSDFDLKPSAYKGVGKRAAQDSC